MSSRCWRPSRPADPEIPRWVRSSWKGRGEKGREGGVAASGNVGRRLASYWERPKTGPGFVVRPCGHEG